MNTNGRLRAAKCPKKPSSSVSGETPSHRRASPACRARSCGSPASNGLWITVVRAAAETSPAVGAANRDTETTRSASHGAR